jgi:predicted HTH transcriptional regulator
MNAEELSRLVHSLRTLPKENEWVEFKENNADPQEIGEYISALANSVALLRKNDAFILWGINNATHELVGTSFDPYHAKIGNQELENWLLTQLTPRIAVQIHTGVVDGAPVVLFQIQPATSLPVAFRGIEYIRVGSYKKRLREHPEKERALWAVFAERPFESCAAVERVSADDILRLIDYPAYFRLMAIPLPDNRAAILERLEAERIIYRQAGNHYDISNVGAILFAADLRAFERLARKAPRVIIYRGDNRIETIKEQSEVKGYATGFETLLNYLYDQLPQNEQIERAFRSEVRMYPAIAIRELVANALIHQDFNLTGTGPMIEIFSDRLEISNPGLPLIDTLRFIDEPPRSRNETLAALMRRLHICEERGSGIDKVISVVEVFQLPAPDFRTTTNHTIAVLFGPREFSDMDRADRIRACYQHACLWFVSGKQMTNTSLRERLKIDKKNYPMASRIIRDTIDVGLIKQAGGSRKDAKYIPFWG